MNLYRARFGITTGSARWSEWKYYENTDNLKVDLLEAFLDIEYQETSRGRDRSWLRLILASKWNKALNGEKNKKVTKIYNVEKAVNDEWVPVAVEFIKPEINLLETT